MGLTRRLARAFVAALAVVALGLGGSAFGDEQDGTEEQKIEQSDFQPTETTSCNNGVYNWRVDCGVWRGET